MKRSTFYCEYCHQQVSPRDRICPHCGRIFTDVRCPECGYTGGVKEFLKGCPSCGYLGEVHYPQERREEPSDGTSSFVMFEKKDSLPASLFWIIMLLLGATFLVLIYFYLSL
ncbi:hypothetical protein Spith_0980 [Spirochaeta thermophila DSM 6578]|uniref:DZANK-type domain-containing protein n=1 Tax=Winmispira thermophila (strain ATCC 700085 / DSM 6578 / Z-1203) TaxID=869211 RepID=G0GCW1_WINT7|nr:zinc ribbon domain-containing protein [Spirochaeta thermophila]AEJ61253.1 hypothetical protein Spith_0980 [Spirochaeta thermophila DSM 6578]